MRLIAKNNKHIMAITLLLTVLLTVLCTSTSFAVTYLVKPGVNLNTRSGPGTQFSRLGIVKPGTMLEELQRKNDWVEVIDKNGQRFWVHNSFLDVSGKLNSHHKNEKKRSKVRVFPNLGHSDNVNSVAISPDGRTILTGSRDGSAILWNAVTGKRLKSFQGHTSLVNSVSFHPDGQTIVTGSEDDTVRIWNIASGKTLRILKGHTSSVTSVTVSPNGRTILSGSNDETARLWEVATGKTLQIFSAQLVSVSSVAFSPDGQTVLTGSWDKNVRLWDINSGKVLRIFEGHTDGGISVAFSPSGKTIATGSNDNTARIWDVETGQTLQTLSGHSGEIKSVAFSPDGLNVLTASEDFTMQLWDVATGGYRGLFVGHTQGVTSVAISPDGQTVLSGSADNTARLWGISSGETLREFKGNSDYVLSVAISPAGKMATAGSKNGETHLWDIKTGKALHTLSGHKSHVKSVAFSPDGLKVLTGSADHTARLWNLISGKLLQSFSGHTGSINGVAFAQNGQTIVTGSHDKTARIWDISSGKTLQILKGHSDSVTSVAFSTDGRTIISGSWDRTLKHWTTTGKTLRTFEGHSDIVLSVAFAANGRTILSGSNFENAILWDIATGNPRRTFESQEGGVYSVAFAPNERSILTGSFDKTAQLWELATGKKQRVFTEHESGVTSVAFLPDGQAIVSGSYDTTTRISGIRTGKERAQFISFDDGEWIVVTPEGFFNASPGGAEHLNVVSGLDVLSIDQVYDVLYRPDLVKEALAGDPDGKVKAAAAKLDLNKVVSSGLSPRVRVISPVFVKPGDARPDPFTADDEIVEVEIELEDTGGGIGRIEWRVNGTTQGEVRDRGFERIAASNDDASDTKPRAIRLKQKLFLSAGTNEISVVAYNHANLIASEPVSFTLDLETTKVAAPKLYVLAVGVDDYYDSRLKLNYAVSDVNSIGEAMSKAGKDLYGEVIVKTVLDEEVTREGLGAAFDELSKQIHPGDVFVFFLAGHGKTLDGRYYFLPRNFRYTGEDSIRISGIGQKVWQNWFARLKAQKSVLLYDTCESGSLTGDLTSRGLENVAAIDRLTRATGRTTLTAATDTAPALEGYRGHGLFTYAILDAIANADGDNDQQIEVTELATYIDRTLPQVSEAAFGYRQIPQMSIRGNSFPLVQPVNVLGDEGDPDKRLKISLVPTHVVIKSTNLLKTASETGQTIRKLAPGTQLRLIELKNGWALVARDGNKVGYVAEATLLGLQ